MRAWDTEGHVSACDWENSEQALGHAGSVVMSVEDINRDLEPPKKKLFSKGSGE